MRELTQFANYHIEIWRRPRQRHMHLTVRPDGRVRVTCNKRSRKGDIFAFVVESALFIEKRTLELESLKKRFPKKEMVSGETFLFLGRALPLQIIWAFEGRIKVTIHENEIEMTAPVNSSVEERAKAMRMFYRKQARLHLEERVKHFSAQMRLYPNSISVRGQSTRWGSCTSRGDISLNMKLMCTPENVIDYVIVHEIAHMTYMNHSSFFWDLVAKYYPEYKGAKAWLKLHEPEIASQFRQ